MTENATPSPAPSGDATSTDQPVEQQPRTVEEVEAFWRNRFSARDKAHNAEVGALQAQLAAAKTTPPPPPENETPEQARVRELEGQLASERSARQAEALKSQYPFAVSMLGDVAGTLAPEKLAAIEAVGGGQPPVEASEPPVIDPNAAPRRPSGTPAVKPSEEKSKDELLADLKAMTPAYQQVLRER